MQQGSRGFRRTRLPQAPHGQRAGSVPALRLPPQPCRTAGSGSARLQAEPRCAPRPSSYRFLRAFSVARVDASGSCLAVRHAAFSGDGGSGCTVGPQESLVVGISANTMLLCCCENSKALLFLCQNKGVLHCVNLPRLLHTKRGVWATVKENTKDM